jgi:hypothetical protein
MTQQQMRRDHKCGALYIDSFDYHLACQLAMTTFTFWASVAQGPTDILFQQLSMHLAAVSMGLAAVCQPFHIMIGVAKLSLQQQEQQLRLLGSPAASHSIIRGDVTGPGSRATWRRSSAQ